MTLTYQLDLDFLSLYIHANIQGRMSVRSAGRVRQMDRQTDGRTMPKQKDVFLSVKLVNNVDGYKKLSL